MDPKHIEVVARALWDMWRASPIAPEWAVDVDWARLTKWAANGHAASRDTRNTVLAEARAAIEAYESAKAAQQWQPIETAPKDGAIVDLWIEAAGRVSFRATGYRWSKYTKTGEFAWLDSIGSDPLEENFMNVGMRATHWTPIPKPPSTPQQGEG